VSTGRTTDDRDTDYRRHNELLSHLKNITERLERIEMEVLNTRKPRPSPYVPRGEEAEWMP